MKDKGELLELIRDKKYSWWCARCRSWDLVIRWCPYCADPDLRLLAEKGETV